MRLIDADCVELVETIGHKAFKTRSDIQDWLNSAPTVDAVQVVRCKDCKFYDDCENFLFDDDYCSSGERKETE